jgi:hypothetical protein
LLDRDLIVCRLTTNEKRQAFNLPLFCVLLIYSRRVIGKEKDSEDSLSQFHFPFEETVFTWTNNSSHTVRAVFHVFVAADVFNDYETEPLVESMRVVIEHEDHMTKKLSSFFSFFHQCSQ